MTDPGKYRDRVRLIPPGDTSRRDSGQRVDVPSTGFEAWAYVRQLTGVEQVRAGQQVSSASYKVMLRYFPGLATDWQIALASGRTLEIGSVVDVDELHEEYEVAAAWEAIRD